MTHSLVQPYVKNAGLFTCPTWSAFRTCRVGFPLPRAQWSYSWAYSGLWHSISSGDDPAGSLDCEGCNRLCPSNQNYAAMSYYGTTTSNAPAPANTIMIIEMKRGYYGYPKHCWTG